VIDGATAGIYVSEYYARRIRRIDVKSKTVRIILDASGRGENYFNFRNILRYDRNNFLLLSRYGMVEANICTGRVSYIFGGSK